MSKLLELYMYTTATWNTPKSQFNRQPNILKVEYKERLLVNYSLEKLQAYYISNYGRILNCYIGTNVIPHKKLSFIALLSVWIDEHKMIPFRNDNFNYHFRESLKQLAE